jgi:hypothetical protein
MIQFLKLEISRFARNDIFYRWQKGRSGDSILNAYYSNLSNRHFFLYIAQSQCHPERSEGSPAPNN